MGDLNKIYSEENIGMPVKVRMGNKGVYIYGRYYGRGYDGESDIEKDDYHMITLVTAGGSLIRGGKVYFEVINDKKEDLEKLKYFEELEEQPYKPFFNIANNKYIKSYEYKKAPLTYEHYPLKWFEEKGYFEIDVDIFGNALSSLFTAYFGEKYFYNNINVMYESKSIHYLNYNDITDSRYMFFLSNKKYKNINISFDNYPYRKRNEFDTMFKQKPISIKENEHLINFGYFHNPKIKLGKVEDGKFIPSTYPFNDASHCKEVNFKNNFNFIVVDFINEIINYKLINRKADLNEFDMYNILEKYGISYKNEMHKLVNVLKNANEKAIDTMIKNNQLGKILTLHK